MVRTGRILLVLDMEHAEGQKLLPQKRLQVWSLVLVESGFDPKDFRENYKTPSPQE